MNAIKFFFALFLLATGIANAQTPVKVACVGNSITEGLDIAEGSRYPDQLQQLLGNGYEVKNFGISGRTLLKKGDYSYWQEERYQQALAWAPDIVIIKLGTNDSKPQNWIYSDEFEKDYRAFIQSFKKLPGKRKIYICLPVPVFKDNFGISSAVVSDEIVPLITKIGGSEKVQLIDLYAAMAGKDALVPDGIHPNAEGAAIIAGEVFKAIRQ